MACRIEVCSTRVSLFTVVPTLKAKIVFLEKKVKILAHELFLCSTSRQLQFLEWPMARLLGQIEKVDAVSRCDARLSRAQIERIDLLFKTIYLLKNHRKRFEEIAALSEAIQDLLGQLYRSMAKSELPLRRKELYRKYSDIDYTICAYSAGYKAFPLIGEQNERYAKALIDFHSLTSLFKHYGLLAYSK